MPRLSSPDTIEMCLCTNIFKSNKFHSMLREDRHKKSVFLVVGPLRLYPPYTIGLVVHATFFFSPIIVKKMLWKMSKVLMDTLAKISQNIFAYSFASDTLDHLSKEFWNKIFLNFYIVLIMETWTPKNLNLNNIVLNLDFDLPCRTSPRWCSRGSSGGCI